MTIDELAVLDGDRCILRLRGVSPILSDKYDVTQHTLYQQTGEYDVKNKLDIEKYLKGGIKQKKEEELCPKSGAGLRHGTETINYIF